MFKSPKAERNEHVLYNVCKYQDYFTGILS